MFINYLCIFSFGFSVGTLLSHKMHMKKDIEIHKIKNKYK